MTTLKKIEASRRNGALSIGPITQTGKQIAARNSLRHGILSSQVVLETEDSMEFAHMEQRMRASLQPVGESEEMFAETIIELRWRLRRLRAVEKGAFEAGLRAPLTGADVGMVFIADSDGPNAFSNLSRYETAIYRAMYKAWDELQRLQAARRREAASAPLVLDVQVSSHVEER